MGNEYAQLLHAMTVDVEDYFHVAAFKDIISPEDWDQQPSRVVENTTRLLDIFTEHDMQATFFILGWVAEREPELIRKIHSAGHEIASHGYSHQLIYSQTPQLFKEETKRSKNILEDITGEPIEGYRAASYSITNSSIWALDILSELGFRWDSSIFPIFHDNYGIPDTPTNPYLIKTSNGGVLTEFPITAARFPGMTIPAAGGGYFRQFPYWVFKYLFERASSGQPRIFYLHPWEVDSEQPRFKQAKWFSKFRHYTNLHKCESRLQQLIKDFRFTSVSNSMAIKGPAETYTTMNKKLTKMA